MNSDNIAGYVIGLVLGIIGGALVVSAAYDQELSDCAQIKKAAHFLTADQLQKLVLMDEGGGE